MHAQSVEKTLDPETLAVLAVLERDLRQLGMVGVQRKYCESIDISGDSFDGIHIGNSASSTAVNVIPNSGGKGYCCKTVVAIAHGTKGCGGLGQVLRTLRAHLIACSAPKSGYATKTAVLIFDVERRPLFWESKRDFATHRQVNGLLAIRCYWDGYSLHSPKLL